MTVVVLQTGWTQGVTHTLLLSQVVVLELEELVDELEDEELEEDELDEEELEDSSFLHFCCCFLPFKACWRFFSKIACNFNFKLSKELSLSYFSIDFLILLVEKAEKW